LINNRWKKNNKLYLISLLIILLSIAAIIFLNNNNIQGLAVLSNLPLIIILEINDDII